MSAATSTGEVIGWILSGAFTALAAWVVRISSGFHALRERVARLEGRQDD